MGDLVHASELGLVGVPRRETACGHGDVREDATRELGGALFGSFARQDQRRKGEQYLRGLLRASGRKSIRNIASHVGGHAAEQSLHHFISSSTWDWMPVREALATHVEQSSPPQAWVVQSMPIPKTGDHSAGVDRWFDQGQMFRGQRAYGVWYASEALSMPVNWRLHLPEQWLRDDARRRRTEIPDNAALETLEQCAASAVLESMGAWRVPMRPVVLNTHITDIAGTIGRFSDAGVPVIAKVSGTARLTVREHALPGYGAGDRGAQQILASVKGLRRRSEWADPARSGAGRRSSLAVAVRVSCDDRELTLLGEWDDPQRSLVALWITNMESVPMGALLRLTKLGARAGRDLATYGENVGLKDFEGRTYRGWHRHMTLASAAHAIAALTCANRDFDDYATQSA